MKKNIFPIILFVIGLLLFVDELYFWIPELIFLHWLPDLSSLHVDPFHHWLWGLIMMIFAFYLLMVGDRK